MASGFPNRGVMPRGFNPGHMYAPEAHDPSLRPMHQHHYDQGMDDLDAHHPQDLQDMAHHAAAMPYSYPPPPHAAAQSFQFQQQGRGGPQPMTATAVPMQVPAAAAGHRQAAGHMHGGAPAQTANPIDALIKEVWADDLEDAMAEVRKLVKTYRFIGMDTEFPGVVARPISQFVTPDFNYQTLRCNVDQLNIIQLGLTFSDGNGNYPTGTITFQFNFHFDLDKHMWAEDSIKMLERSGINFQRHRDSGIKASDFGQLLMTSGMVMFDSVHWISFHSYYDFAYLLKIITCSPLPAEQSKFLSLLNLYFPRFYDIKVLMKSCKNLKGGLEALAQYIEVKRIGPQHQAGSDSLLTSAVFFKMLQVFFDNTIDRQYTNVLYGIGKN